MAPSDTSDDAELERLAEERLPDVHAVLGDRWSERQHIEFSAPDEPDDQESQGNLATAVVAALTRCPSVPLWRSFNKVERQPTVRPGGPSFRINGIDAPVLRQTLLSNGLAPTTDRDQVILWNGSRVADNTYRLLNAFQKVNHFPGSTELTQKDRTWVNLRTMAKRFGKAAFNFIPETYIVPEQLDEFLKCYQRTDYFWIVKPHASSCGRGIFMLKNIDEIPLEGTSVISRYVHKPLLIQSLKFDLRIYVVVTSFEPLRAYVYREGLVRFASKPYSTKGKDIHDVYRHLTNYSVNKNAPGFTENKEVAADNVGHKWSFSALNRHLHHVGLDHDLMWMRIMDLLVKTLFSVQPAIVARQKELNMRHQSCFEVYGFDVLVDEALKPWLLEVNLSPSMRAESPLDWRIKSSLLSDTFNLVGICSDPASQIASSYQEAIGGFRSSARAWGSIQRVASMPALGANGFGVLASAKDVHYDTEHGVAKEAIPLDALSEESKRCENFCRLYPTRKAVAWYAPITEKWLIGAKKEQASTDGLPLSASQLLASVLLGPPPLRAPPRPRSTSQQRRRAETPPDEFLESRAVVPSEVRRLPESLAEAEAMSSSARSAVPSLGAQSIPSGDPRPPQPPGPVRPRYPDALLVERHYATLPRARVKVMLKAGLPPMPLQPAKAPGSSLGSLGLGPDVPGRPRPPGPPGGGLVAEGPRRGRPVGGSSSLPPRRRAAEDEEVEQGLQDVGVAALRAPSPEVFSPWVFTSSSLHSEMRNIEL